jgi:hypothetical protein
LINDLIDLISETIDKFDLHNHIKIPLNVSCKTENIWTNGSKWKDSLKLNTLNGLSGNVQFDSFGKRENLTFSIVEKQRNNLELVWIFYVFY